MLVTSEEMEQRCVLKQSATSFQKSKEGESGQRNAGDATDSVDGLFFRRSLEQVFEQ